MVISNIILSLDQMIMSNELEMKLKFSFMAYLSNISASMENY
jgi:hypothetical protein